jgi:carboxyl-terminal processing protease
MDNKQKDDSKKKSSKKESNLMQKITLVLPSLVIVSLIFASGYFVGTEKSNDFMPKQFGNAAGAYDEADLTSFWKAWNLIDDKFIPASSTQPISNTDRVYGAISGMVDSLGDPYTVFLQPEANEMFNESIKGNFSGVGMEIGMEEGFLTVIAPLKNTPAELAGVQAGDIILEIDGISTINVSLDDAVDKIRGEVGTVVTITVAREGLTEAKEISITRDVIEIPTMDYELRDDGIYEISMYNFSANAANDFRKALREFVESGSSKILLDLRGNPGGYLEAAVDISSWFLPAGKTIVQEDFGDDNVKYLRSKGYDIFNDNLKMVVLVNKGSASASEIVSGALQEYDIATLIGTQTFGKGSVQELVEINPETSLKVTIARWLTPLGRSISDGGLTPDITIDTLPNETKNESGEIILNEDVTLPEDYNRAEELFNHQKQRAIEILKEM